MASPVPYYYPPRRRSVFGPIVLIVIGALLLMRNFGYRLAMLNVLGRWWPVLLLIWGGIRLWEYYDARRHGELPPRFGFWGVVLLFIVVSIGAGVQKAHNWAGDIDWSDLRNGMEMDDDFSGLFGNSFTYDGSTEAGFPAGSALKVINDRGNVTVNASDDGKVHVNYHKRVFAGSQQEADKVDQSTVPQVSQQGNVVLVNANTEGSGGRNVATDLEITVPRAGWAELASRRGDIIVNGRNGDLKVTISKGDVTLTDISGNATINMQSDDKHGSLHCDKVTGSLTANGRFQDAMLANITGPVAMNGDFFGDIRLSSLSKGVTFHSSRTELEIARVDGELTMGSGDLRASSVLGPFNLKTKGKNIELENVQGDARVTNTNGDISVQPSGKLPMGNIEVNNEHGDVRLELPAKAGFRWTVATRHGSIDAGDFSTSHSGDGDNAAASGVVGNGASTVSVKLDSGDIQLRRNNNAPMALPAAPAVPAVPAPPAIGEKGKSQKHQLHAPATVPKVSDN